MPIDNFFHQKSGIFVRNTVFFNVITLIVCLISVDWNCWGSITVQKTLLSNFIFIRMDALKLFLLKIAQIWVNCDPLRFLNRAFVTEQRFGFLFSTDDLCSLSGPILTSSSHHPAMYHEGMLLQLFAAKEKTACLFFFFSPSGPK